MLRNKYMKHGLKVYFRLYDGAGKESKSVVERERKGEETRVEEEKLQYSGETES